MYSEGPGKQLSESSHINLWISAVKPIILRRLDQRLHVAALGL